MYAQRGLQLQGPCGPGSLSRFWIACDPNLAGQPPPTPPSGGGLGVDVGMEGWGLGSMLILEVSHPGLPQTLAHGITMACDLSKLG